MSNSKDRPKKGTGNFADTRGKTPTVLPKNHADRWPTLVRYLDNGLSWPEAYRKTYPELDDKQLVYCMRNLRYYNKGFRKFIVKRQSALGENTKMPRSELLDHLIQIVNFNIAELYKQDLEGSVQLKDDWLERAKQYNVLERIVVNRKTVTKQNGDEVVNEIINVVPYSRLSALGRIAGVLGYVSNEKAPGNVNAIQQNNTFLVSQVNDINKAIKNGKIPIDADAIDEKMMKELGEVEIVRKGGEDE